MSVFDSGADMVLMQPTTSLATPRGGKSQPLQRACLDAVKDGVLVLFFRPTLARFLDVMLIRLLLVLSTLCVVRLGSCYASLSIPSNLFFG